MIMVLLVLKVFASSHHLNFGGVLAFMFCYSMKDKRDTTLPCFYYDENKRITFNASLFVVIYLCSFHVAT